MGDADLVMEREGDCVAVTFTVLDVPSTVPPEGVVPLAVAVSTIVPWSTSAWVTT